MHAVIVGMGYVGLPLAEAASKAGIRVTGYDVSAEIVKGLESGRSHVGDVANEALAIMHQQGFQATTDPAVVTQADAVIICVPTPLDPNDRSPDLRAVTGATRSVGDHLTEGTVVVLESTTYPGTTEDVVRPILEESSSLKAGIDFHLAYSPERVDPGSSYRIEDVPKIVSGLTDACRDAAADFYGQFITEVVLATGPAQAEMAKLLENTYRHINIALVNEMAIFSHELGIDLWETIRLAATKPFGFQPFYPGPGIGGHCIPIDPGYLSYKVRSLGYPFRFVELAEEINARMPAYVATRISSMLNDRSKPIRGSRILLLGVSYKADVTDTRESPAVPLGRRLLELGADLSFHDPGNPRWDLGDTVILERAPNLIAAVEEADVLVLLQAHSEYDLQEIASRAACVLDTRGVVEGPDVERL